MQISKETQKEKKMTKEEAKQYLVQIGYLIPAEQQPLYHWS